MATKKKFTHMVCSAYADDDCVGNDSAHLFTSKASAEAFVDTELKNGISDDGDPELYYIAEIVSVAKITYTVVTTPVK
jgi:hypothetical protein